VILDELNDKLKKKRMTNYEYVSTVSRLTPLHDESASWKRHFASADLVIEAVFEVRLSLRCVVVLEYLLIDHRW
jgi:enoyl-CoA hydratase/long-chain 3-hydroxyacyl-CoA dehydrogenase